MLARHLREGPDLEAARADAAAAPGPTFDLRRNPSVGVLLGGRERA